MDDIQVHVVAVCKVAPGVQFYYRTFAISAANARQFAAEWTKDEYLEVEVCDGTSWCTVAECNVLACWWAQQ